MTGGLVDALLLGGGLSFVAGGAAWALARLQRRGEADTDIALWRAARLVALLPVPLAAMIYAVPQTVSAGGEALVFEPQFVETADPLPVAVEAGGFVLPALPSLTQTVLALYLAGLVVSLGLAGLRHLARRRLIAASRPASREERRPLEALAEDIGVRAPEMRVGPDTASPILTGWRGVVLVPAAMLSRADALRFALAHELSHLRRGDERDRLVGAALIALFWFNLPLRWIERELNAAREIACDRDTLEALGGARRKAYAAALIETMRIAAPAASAFGPHDRRHREMRIKAIMTSTASRRGRAAWLAATILAAGLPVAGAQALITERRVVAEPAEHVAPEQDAQAPIQAAFAAQQDEDWQASIDQLSAIVDAPRSSAHDQAIALQMRGRAHYELGQAEAAIADWQRAIDTGAMDEDGNRNMRINISQLMIANGDAEAGAEALEAALGEDEPDLRFMRMLAQAYGHAGRFEDGLGYARAVYSDDPAESNYHLLYYYLQELGMERELAELIALQEERATSGEPKINRREAPVAPVAAEPSPEPHPAPHAEPASEPSPVRQVRPAPQAEPRAEPRPVMAPAPSLTHRVAHGRISSRYGDRPARPAGAQQFHHGVDIAADRGTPIVAPGPGVVVHAAAGFNGEAAWGNTVAIDHGNGWQTVYAHMEGFDVSVGDRVSSGQQIGRVGSTGRSTGPHVHVELHQNGQRIDPAEYLPGLR